jgi:hypothetical protein
MAFLFRNKQKSHQELARETKDLMVRHAQDDKANPKVRIATGAAQGTR